MKTVLVIDGDREMGWLLSRAIRALPGIDSLYAISGPEALGMIHSQKPDLLVIDPLLTGMHGFELLLRLNNQADIGQMPTIVVTGHFAEVPRDLAPNIVATFHKASLDVKELLEVVKYRLSKETDSECAR